MWHAMGSSAVPPGERSIATSTTIRRHLVDALRADLVGPFLGSGEELLELTPSRWYLTGFLAPEHARVVDDPTEDDELAAGDDPDAEETDAPEPEAKRPNFLPASIGLSVLLPPGGASDTLGVTLRWADYLRREAREDDGEREGGGKHVWQRVARAPEPITLPVDATRAITRPVPGSGGLYLVVHVKTMSQQSASGGLEAGTRAVSVFLVNGREPGEKGAQDEAFVFQVEMEVRTSCGIVARPNPRDEQSDEWDAAVADLQFRDVREYAVGHGVAVESFADESGGRVVRTTWVPEAVVKRVRTRSAAGITTGMEALGALENGAQAREALSPLVEAYGAWIESQRALEVGGKRRSEVRDRLMDEADRARRRSACGS